MRRIFCSSMFLLILVACNSTATPTPGSVLPYQTDTPVPTFTLLPPQTEVVLPTPTVFAYTIVQGDTLSGIALRFGVSLEELTAVNPGIQPTALVVGTKLIIPAGGGASGGATPSPAPLPVRQARCWPGTDSGQWCFALIQNNYAETMENLSAQFVLLSPNGNEVASQIVYAALDILPPGQSMPLAAYFPPPVAKEVVPRVQILTSTLLLPGDSRYLPVALYDTLVRVDWSGRTAQVSGRTGLSGSTGSASTLWVLAAAYDTAGEVVGVRRWESSGPLAAGQSSAFNFSVASVGPPIDRVEFLAEARP